MGQGNPVSLMTLGIDAALKIFDFELKKVLENIVDENSLKDTRKITLEVTIKPKEDQDFNSLSMERAGGEDQGAVKPEKHKEFLAGEIMNQYGPNSYVTDVIAADIIGSKVQTLLNWRHLRKGPPYTKKGRMVRYRVQDILDYMSTNRIDPEARR
jgi:hypothetical protein